MDRELVIVLDFGGQYNQLIARRVRECNVYCEVHPYTLSLDKIREMNPKGIIFTGGPNSVYGEDSPRCPKEIFEMGIPILGICYGSQLMSYMLGGSVKTAPVSEYGKTEVAVDTESALFKNVSPSTICWNSNLHPIPQCVRLQEWKMQRRSCMQYSSIRRLCILRKALRCFPILYMISVDAQVTGRWILSWRQRSTRSVKRLETARCCVHFPAVWILLLQQFCCPRRSASSCPVCL